MPKVASFFFQIFRKFEISIPAFILEQIFGEEIEWWFRLGIHKFPENLKKKLATLGIYKFSRNFQETF